MEHLIKMNAHGISFAIPSQIPDLAGAKARHALNLRELDPLNPGSRQA